MSSFLPPNPTAFSSFSLFPLLPLQPFMSPRYPGGPRPSLRMPNQVINTWFDLTPQRSSTVTYFEFSPFVLFCFFVYSQPPGGIPGSQPLLPNSLDPTRPQGKAPKADHLLQLELIWFSRWRFRSQITATVGLWVKTKEIQMNYLLWCILIPDLYKER